MVRPGFELTAFLSADQCSSILAYQAAVNLIAVDYFSNFWEIDRLRDTKASTCVYELNSQFVRNGIPDVVISQTTDHNSPLQSSLSSEENGALSTRLAVLVINRQMVRLNLLSRRPRASSGRQRKAKVTPTLQYLQHETPLQNTYGLESSAKTAGKTHQNPTAHNS